MNIFLAGIHGVGKSYLGSRIPKDLGLTHVSASTLIREERSLPEWGKDKLVSNVDLNQVALAAAVRRRNEAGEKLLIDGHFVLLNKDKSFALLGEEVFQSLNLAQIILLEANIETIAARLQERDGQNVDLAKLKEFINTEASQANLVCEQLAIPLKQLISPTIEDFVGAIRRT